MATEIQTEIPATNYRKYTASIPSYKMRRIVLANNSTNAITMPTASLVTLQFRLPNEVYNLSKSYISYNLSSPAIAATSIWTPADCPEMFGAIRFTDNGGAPVANIQFAQRYSRIMRKLNTKLKDYNSADINQGLSRSNAVVNEKNAILPFVTGKPVEYVASLNYVENKYTENTDINTPLNLTKQVVLGELFPESIFGMDRDIFWGKEMFIEIDTANANNAAFISTNAAQPYTGNAPFAGNITINNIVLYLAMEQNAQIKTAVMGKLQTGHDFLVPYPYMQRLPAGGAGGSSLGLNWTIYPSQGLYLKKIIWQAYNSTETSNTIQDCSNYNGRKILSYQTTMDSQPLQDFMLSCANSAGGLVGDDDWRENQKFCDDSVIMNKDIYRDNWFHCDSYTDDIPNESVPAENIAQGLVLDVNHQWAFNATAGPNANNLQHYLFAIVQRKLTLTPQGFFWDMGKGQNANLTGPTAPV